MCASVGQKSSTGGGKLTMDPECRACIPFALKFSSVWSEVVELSKSKGGKVITPVTRCDKVLLTEKVTLTGMQSQTA